ncbi:Fc.00g018410.m01.CDS01 [Cosmosporella sp. VM-42]
MPRRPSDNDPNKQGRIDKGNRPVAKKSERTHAENQERAYIAASRRSDRSLEARIQSAKQASTIHKQRTGKALKITDEIVQNEEMYEEEEDYMPRSYKVLAPQMETASHEFNHRIDTFLKGKIEMSNLVAATGVRWQHETAINREFAQAFPNATQQAHRLSQQFTPSLPTQPTPNVQHQNSQTENGQFQNGQTQNGQLRNGQHAQQTGTLSPPQNYTSQFQNVHYNPQDPTHYHQQRSSSFSAASPSQRLDSDMDTPPVLTPGATPQSQHASPFANNMLTTSSMDFTNGGSAFTNELPAEARQMLPPGDWNFDSFYTMAPTLNWEPDQMLSQDMQDRYYGGSYLQAQGNYFRDPVKFESTAQPNHAGEEPAWDTFLNDDFNTETISNPTNPSNPENEDTFDS